MKKHALPSEVIRHGTPAEVLQIMDTAPLKDNNDPADLKSALLNCLERIAILEEVISHREIDENLMTKE